MRPPTFPSRLDRVLRRTCTLAIILGSLAFTRAEAAIQFLYADNYAHDYAYFNYTPDNGANYYGYTPYQHTDQNGFLNSYAQVADTYNSGGQNPNFPTMNSNAYGTNSTDGLTYVYTYGYANSYSNPSSNYGFYGTVQSNGYSRVDFTLPEESTAILDLAAYAYTDFPGASGSNTAAATARLTDISTGFYYNLTAQSDDGSPTQDYAVTIPLTLSAGDYFLEFSSAYTTGYSYNIPGGSDVYQVANASAYLHDIEAVVGPVVGEVPEPLSLIVWSLLGLAYGGAAWWRRRYAA